MAYVDHKKIKQLIYQKARTVTDRQFFSSPALAAHFADIALAQTKRYGYQRRIKVQMAWKPKESTSAQTNNEHIWINAGHRSITKHKGRPARYEQVCGKFAHELGHVLYTDFLTSQTYHSRQEANQWYPEQPLLRNSVERYAEAEIMEYFRSDPNHCKALAALSHTILNILEDGYIEQRIITDYPGVLGSSLQAMRDSAFADMKDLSDMVDSEAEDGHIWLTICQALLSYMKWGTIKYGSTSLSDERVQVVFGLLGDLDKALTSRDFRDRCRAANLILVRCWGYIKDFLDVCEECAQESIASGRGASADDIAQLLMSILAGGSTEGEGNSAPVADSASMSAGSGSPTADNRAATAKLAADAAGGDDDEMAAPAGTAEANGEADGVSAESSSQTQASQPDPVTDTEGGRIPLTQTSTLYVPESGEIKKVDGYTGTHYPNAAADIERVLEQVAEGIVHKELERQRTKELTELAQNISYGNIHSGVSMTVHRIDEVDDDLKDQYSEISGELLRISKMLQKSVLQNLQDSRRGGKQTGLLMGRRLDTHALCRSDGHVFYKNALPNEVPALSVALLLDESGSMGYSDRATYARATAIILYDFCQALDIPIMVYGHSTSHGVDLYSYAEFDAIDQDDRYRMMDITAHGSNRDGAALRFVAEQLSRRTEDVKLLMLVSDGQPADIGYGGTAAEEDLRGIQHEYQHNGILFVAAAIGSDKENIERIYGDSFLDITDLTQLPVKLAGIIKRFIR